MRKKKQPKQRSRAFQIREPELSYKSARLSSLSLFSGAGGMDIGVEAAGFHTLACVEWDVNAAETLRLKAATHPTETRVIHADIREVDPKDTAPVGIDLLFGGPPCQSFSLIGKRGSLHDERGLLLFEMARFAKRLRPRAILMEQVKGLLSAPDQAGERGGAFRSFVRQLTEQGYTVKWSVLCAADYGIPQLRERVFIVALRGGNGFYFPPPTHAEDPEETPLFSLQPYTGAWDVISDLPAPLRKTEVAPVPNHIDVTTDRDRERIQVVPEGSYLACQLHVPKSIRGNLSKKDTTKYRRLHRAEPALTLRCGEIFFHPTEDRYLTPREYMRLHGYPDWHVLCGPVRSRSGRVTDLDQHRLVANSVPPPLAKIVAEQIARALRNEL